MSGYRHQRSNRDQVLTAEQKAEQRAENMIREAEMAKIQLLEMPGRKNNLMGTDFKCKQDFVHTVMVDESFMLVATHIDDNLKGKIKNGNYVDFARLLLRDRIMDEQNQRLEWVQDRSGAACFYNLQQIRGTLGASLVLGNGTKHSEYSQTFIAELILTGELN